MICTETALKNDEKTRKRICIVIQVVARHSTSRWRGRHRCRYAIQIFWRIPSEHSSCERIWCGICPHDKKRRKQQDEQQQRWLPDQRQQKRIKLTASAGPTTPADGEDCCSVVAHYDDDDDLDVDTSDGERRMPVDKIIWRLQAALAPIVHTDCSNDYLSEPVGTVLRPWTTLEDRKFVLTLADSSQAVSNHSILQQRLAIWYIETVNDVDKRLLEGTLCVWVHPLPEICASREVSSGIVMAKKRVPKRKAATSESTESMDSNQRRKKAWARCRWRRRWQCGKSRQLKA